MASDRALSSSDVIDFLRNEAPREFERLESIARLVTPAAEGPQGGSSSRSPWYAAWIQEALENAGTQCDGIPPPEVAARDVRRPEIHSHAG